MKSRILKMNELQRTTWNAAVALCVALLLVFLCIFRVSNATALVVVASVAILGFVSLVTESRLRYVLLVLLVAALALELFLREPSSTLANIGVLARFAVTGILVTYFATLLTRASHNLYLDMRRLASERKEALADSRRWLTRVNALVMVISTISTKNHLRDIFTEGLEEARKVFSADSGLIYSVDPESGHMSVIGSFGYSDEVLDKMMRRGVENASACQACTDLHAVAVDNLATDDKCANLQKVTTGSSICLPIEGGESLLGVLHLRRRHPDAFTPEDIQLAQAMTYQFGLAMQRASLFEQVNRLAITDSITGLYNYRKLTRDLDREIVRSRRYHHPFSFIMADIDHFKVLNDTYGHPAGDAVLRGVADALNSERREVDRVYRYGGEEFSILLPETDWPEAFEVAEKLRRKVEDLEVVVTGEEEPIKTTISMGVASFSRDSLALEHLISSADEALYSAKETGRNRVVAHASLASASEGEVV
ncbi:MAG: sensor domain-containing diguanylate cyclase [Candidatus Geothermincolia bacterium]